MLTNCTGGLFLLEKRSAREEKLMFLLQKGRYVSYPPFPSPFYALRLLYLTIEQYFTSTWSSAYPISFLAIVLKPTEWFNKLHSDSRKYTVISECKKYFTSTLSSAYPISFTAIVLIHTEWFNKYRVISERKKYFTSSRSFAYSFSFHAIVLKHTDWFHKYRVISQCNSIL